MRRLVLGGLLATAAGALVVGLAPAAQAHPLGNFTVNYYEGLTLRPHAVAIAAVIDTAELPTYNQVEPAVDTNHDGRYSAAERSAYAATQCARLARGLQLTVAGRPVRLAAKGGALRLLPSTALRGLFTARTTCSLTAVVDLSRPTSVRFVDAYDQRYGWHEITVVGAGVHVERSSVDGTTAAVAATSISDDLRHYPNALLSSPLDVREVELTAAPGAGPAARGHYTVAGASLMLRALQPVTNAFFRAAGSHRLTLPVGLLALLLAVALGAGHAALPGHGKTVMAAYLVGRRGSLRDAVVVGGTVTITHTAGVLLVGLLISASAAVVDTGTLRWLGIASGLLVASVGAGLLRGALRQRRPAPMPPHPPEPAAELATVGAGPSITDHHHPHGHEHAPGHGHAAAALAEHRHPHRHPLEPHHHQAPPFTRRGLVGMGIAGGLVPSPSALVVLLSAIALGRTVFGVVLVLGYGAGMAVTLVAAGLLLVRLRDRFVRPRWASRLRGGGYLRALPVLTAILVIVVGVGLTVRSLGTPA